MIRAGWSTIVAYVTCVLALLVIPVLTQGYILSFLTMTWILAISVIGLYLISTTGEINFAHVGFMAVGAYISGLVSAKLGMSVWLALPAAGIASGLLGLGLGFLTLRLKGAYFFLVSFAVASLLLVSITQLRDITGGPQGMHVPPLSEAFKSSFVPFYYLAAALLIAVFALAKAIVRSRTGTTVRGIAQADSLAQAVGIDVVAYKSYVLAISTLIAGLSGALLGHFLAFINPESFGTWQMINILSYLVVGGMGSATGAVLGTVILRVIGEAAGGLREYQILVSSTLLLVVIMLFPGGLVSLSKRMVSWRGRSWTRSSPSSSITSSISSATYEPRKESPKPERVQRDAGAEAN